jgi:GTP-binding protein
MLVSNIAGTTVDAVEAEFDYGEQRYILIDTAGLRRKSRRHDGVEAISAFKSEGAIDKADIVLLMIDGNVGVTDQDNKMIEYALNAHKAIILVANKLDIAKLEIPEFRKTFRENISKEIHYFKDIPVAFISAKTGAGIKDLFLLVEEMWKKLHTKISTSKLNKFFYEAIRLAPAPVWGTKNVKFYYLTQTHQTPPSFIAFANHPGGVDNSYRRFLSKKIKEEYNLKGVPIRIFVMRGRS